MQNPQTITFASEAGFQALFECATIGILVIDTVGSIALANPCAEGLFGYRNAELVGQSIETLVPVGMQKRHVHYRDEYFKHPKARPMGYGLNLRARRKDGSEFPAEISLAYYELAGELRAVAFISDVSEKRKAEEQLEESAKEYRLIFEGIHESFMLQQIVKDANGLITDLLFLEVNPAAQKLLGRSREEIVGHLRSEFFGPLDEKLIEVILRVEKGENITYQQYISHIGRWFDRRFYSYKPGQLIALSIDITQQKQDEAMLRKSQAMFESEAAALAFLNECGIRLWRMNDLEEGLQEMLTDFILLAGSDKGNVQLLDQERQVLTIATQKGFTGEFLEYFREVSASGNSACGRALKDKTQIVIEDTETEPSFAEHAGIARRSDFRAVQSTPLFGHDGSPIGMVSTHYREPHQFNSQELNKLELFARKAESFVERCVMYDNLEKKVAERTYELAMALERERELSELKSRFMSIASHEFRTALSTILSSASLIESYKKEEQDSNRTKHIGRIKAAVNNLNGILGEFLSLDKLEQGKILQSKETINFHLLSSNIIDDLDNILKDGQRIFFSYTGNETIIQDKKILTNVLLNLLSNAIKYSSEHKNIYLSVENINNSVSIQVKDEGIGIPEDDQKHLFSTFYRARNAANIQGTGLGLHIVKRYVELLEGTIRFVSKLGKGTTFFIVFPAS